MYTDRSLDYLAIRKPFTFRELLGRVAHGRKEYCLDRVYGYVQHDDAMTLVFKKSLLCYPTHIGFPFRFEESPDVQIVAAQDRIRELSAGDGSGVVGSFR